MSTTPLFVAPPVDADAGLPSTDYSVHAQDTRALPRVNWGANLLNEDGTPAAPLVLRWEDVPAYNALQGRFNVWDRANMQPGESEDAYLRRAMAAARHWAEEDAAAATIKHESEAAAERRREQNRLAQQRWREKNGLTGPVPHATPQDVVKAAAALAQAEAQRTEALAAIAVTRKQWDDYVAGFRRAHKLALRGVAKK